MDLHTLCQIHSQLTDAYIELGNSEIKPVDKLLRMLGFDSALKIVSEAINEHPDHEFAYLNDVEEDEAESCSK